MGRKKHEFVYVICSCDEWKSIDSFRVVGVMKNFDLLKLSIERLVENGVVGLEGKTYDLSNYETAQEFNSIDYLYVNSIMLDAAILDGGYYF